MYSRNVFLCGTHRVIEDIGDQPCPYCELASASLEIQNLQEQVRKLQEDFDRAVRMLDEEKQRGEVLEEYLTPDAYLR